MTIDQAFNQSVEYYDRWMKKALPCYDEMFALAQALIPFDPLAGIDVLDLGAGTGLFSQHVLIKYPDARFVLYDVADEMLKVAQARFFEHRAGFSFIVGDMRDIEGNQKFDLVISSLSIHHLTHEQKRDLFGQIYKILRDGGAFINVDQIQGPTKDLQAFYWTHWLDHVRANGASEKEIQASVYRRTTYDKDASLADQLEWLREAGFVDVDCVFKHTFLGVFFAIKK